MSSRRSITWRRVLPVMALAFWGTVAARALAPADAKAIGKLLDSEAKALSDEGTELRDGRKLVEKTFSNPAKPDVFAFLVLTPEEGNSYAVYLYVLSDKGKGYAVVASSPVGGAIERIEIGYVEVQNCDIFLRSDEIADVDNDAAYGEEKVFYRWHVAGRDLKRVGGVWLKRGNKFDEAKKK